MSERGELRMVRNSLIGVTVRGDTEWVSITENGPLGRDSVMLLATDMDDLCAWWLRTTPERVRQMREALEKGYGNMLGFVADALAGYDTEKVEAGLRAFLEAAQREEGGSGG